MSTANPHEHGTEEWHNYEQRAALERERAPKPPTFLAPEKPGADTGLTQKRPSKPGAVDAKGAHEVKPPASPVAPHLETITGAALMQLELPEPPAVVPGFFVEGLTLLSFSNA